MKKVILKDKNQLQKFFKTVKEPLADTTFTMRYVWAEPLRHRWAIINNNLCFFGFFKDRYVLWGHPIGGNKPIETLIDCFNIVKRLNENEGIKTKPIAIYIPEEFKDEHISTAVKNGFTFGYWTQDYIYTSKDLIQLKSKKYKSKRNLVNIFARNENISVEEFNFEKHSNECLKLIDLWRQRKEDVINEIDKYALDTETNAAKKLVRFSNHLGVKGIILKSDEKLIGVSLGEPLNDEMCSNIMEKTNNVFRGASEFIFREFARYWSSYQYLNAQDDFRVEYLKRIKLSYHPVKLLKSYYLEKNK